MSSRCISLYFGVPMSFIYIYRYVSEEVLLIDKERTDSEGIMRWNPKEEGLYDFVSRDKPSMSRYRVVIGRKPVGLIE